MRQFNRAPRMPMPSSTQPDQLSERAAPRSNGGEARRREGVEARSPRQSPSWAPSSRGSLEASSLLCVAAHKTSANASPIQTADKGRQIWRRSGTLRARLLFAVLFLVALCLAGHRLVSARPHQMGGFQPAQSFRDYGILKTAPSIRRADLSPEFGPDRGMSYEGFALDEEDPMNQPEAANRLGRWTQGRNFEHGPQRRDDLEDDMEDDDDGDQAAAASYRNQDEQDGGASVGGRDGYGETDPEPDAAYEETPNDQDGQADLERFFDDHLGASDREGMDKENLPSNLVHQLADPAQPVAGQKGVRLASESGTRAASGPVSGPPEPVGAATVATTSYIRLPDKKKLLVTRREVIRRNLGASNEPKTGRENKNDHSRPAGHSEGAGPGGKVAASSENAAGQIRRWSEDDDSEPVFVTNATNKPFKIDALGGYDPEQDFREAAAELGEPQTRREATTKRAVSSPKARRKVSAEEDQDEDEGELGKGVQREEAKSRQRPHSAAGSEASSNVHQADDISFNADPETEMLYEDASETDEVTFGRDSEPYQTDLEAEMRQQEFDRVGKFLSDMAKKEIRGSDKNLAPSVDRSGHDKAVSSTENNQYSPEENNESEAARFTENARPSLPTNHRPKQSQLTDSETDSDEGAWINDGVDEMEIPSQSHQNEVLERAAKQDEARKAAANGETNPDGSTATVDETSAAASAGQANAPPGALHQHPSGDELDSLEEQDGDNTARESPDSSRSSDRNAERRSLKSRAGSRGKSMQKDGIKTGRQTKDDDEATGEGAQRMPTADYLSKDLNEDDFNI